MQLERGANNNNRTARVVDPLAQQVLAEASLLAFDHVGQGLERTAVAPGNGAAAPAVVQQGVNRLLQHALFVAHNNIGRIEVEQALEAVVAVDDPAIQIVEVGCGKAATVQRHQRAQVGRQNRQNGQNHVFRTVARLQKPFNQLDAARQTLDFGLRVCGRNLLAQRLQLGVQINVFKQRSEEHTSELQSRGQLVCRLLLVEEKKEISSNYFQ